MKSILGTDFQLIYLDIPEPVRFSFFTSRPSRQATAEAFVSRSSHRVEREVVDLRTAADLVVTSTDLPANVEAIASYLRHSWK